MSVLLEKEALQLTRLWERVALWAEERPEEEAVIFEDARISWRALNARVDEAACAFLEAGLCKGDRLVMISMAQPEFLVSWMAASKIGAVWCGLTPKTPVEELQRIFMNAQPTLVITTPRFGSVDMVARVQELCAETPSVMRLLALDGGGPGVESFGEFVARPRPGLEGALEEAAGQVCGEDEALLIYTSGSTGLPKGVVHTHASLMNNARYETLHYEFKVGERILLHFPINHIAALVEMGYSGVYAGCTIIMMDTFNPLGSLEMIERERVNIIGQVPLMYLMQLRMKKFQKMDWSSMRLMVWGASGASLKLITVLDQVAKAHDIWLSTGYGSTEVGGLISYTQRGASPKLLTNSLGRSFDNCEVKVVDENRETVEPGEVGEIALRGPFLMKGYYRNPYATAQVMDEEGWYYTRDLGYLDEEGDFYIAGRSSEMYKTAGENIFPREVESVIEAHPGVAMSAVIGVPHDFYGEVGHAFVMLAPGQELEEKALRMHCRAHLAKCKCPKKFELRSELPLLSNGKINKPLLRKDLGLQS